MITQYRIGLYLLGLTLGAIFSTYAHSQTIPERGEIKPFYYQDVKGTSWYVDGNQYPSHPEQNACFASTKYNDGSTVQLMRNLDSKQWSLTIHNTRWEIGGDTGDIGKGRINMYQRSKVIEGGPMSIVRLSKNEISIPDIYGKSFLTALLITTKIELIMPGNVPNAVINTTGADKIVGALFDCIARWNKVKPGTDKGI